MPFALSPDPVAIRLAGLRWWPSVLVGVSLLGPVAARAQTASTATAVIAGTVIDVSSARMPGVAVTVVSPALMGSRLSLTADNGAFTIAALPPGLYTLSATRAGFATEVRDGVYLAGGFTATIDITMRPQAVSETARATGHAPTIDRRATSLGVTFDTDQLRSLPGSRSMSAVLSATPGVYVSRFDVGGSSPDTGQYGAYGTYGANRPMVEGLSVTGIASTGLGLDLGSFEEVSVGTGSHGPEWHSAGVQMQFVSKSGGNTYRGALYADFEHRHWQASNIDDGQLRTGGALSTDANRLWSYRDVNADIGGYVLPDRLWWYFSIRDQDVEARQVNFPLGRDETRLTNYTGKTTMRISPEHTVVAYAQAGRTHRPFRLDAFGPVGGSLTGTTAVHVSEDSTSRDTAWGWLGKVEWNGMFGNRSFAEVRAGQFGSNRSESPNGTGRRFEDVDTLIVDGASRDWATRYRRHQAIGSFSRFQEGRFGEHLLRAGGEIFLTSEAEIWRHGYGDDVLHVLRGGLPAEVYLLETPSRSENRLWTYSAYVQDAWQPHRRLRFNLGARFDRYRVSLPPQSHPSGRFNLTEQSFDAVDTVIAWNVVTPRFGLTFDLAGDGRTVLKASAGRYTLAPGNGIGANANPNPGLWWTRFNWTDRNRNGIWEDGEQVGSPTGVRGGVATESLDPSLELPLVTEAAAWVEREMAGGIGFRTGVVWRSGSGYFARVNVNRPFSAFTVPAAITDPGPDGRTGTSDDGDVLLGWDLPAAVAGQTPVNRVENIPGARSEHWTWEAVAQRRFAGRWSMLAGFAHVWNGDQNGLFAGQAVRQNTYPVTPNDLIHADRDGRYDFRTWTAKVHAMIDGPWGFRVAPLVRHQSGQPFGRTFSTRLAYGTVRVLAEPMDARRMDNVTLVDLRVEKGIVLPGSRRVALFVDLYNLLNANPEPNVNWASGRSFLQPLAIVPPRIARLGIRLDW